MAGKITIRDVARQANVSPATVSRVLNKPDLVDSETRQRVRDIMETLGFRPNAVARRLSAQNTDTIGLMVPGMSEFYFNELYLGVEQATRENGLHVLLFDSKHSRQQALEGFTFLKEHQVGGIIFTSKVVDEDFDPILNRLGLPVALTLTEARGRTLLPSFKVDDVKAMFDVVSYLVARGHQRIGLISGHPSEDLTGQMRLLGYQIGLKHFDRTPNPGAIEPGAYSFEGGYVAMQRLLEKQDTLGLTAVCAASDEMAIGAIRCLDDYGLSVPHDMSIVGFDNLRISHMMTPGLTTIDQPFADIGVQAVRALIQMMHNPELPKPSGVHYLPHQLIERSTVRSLL